MICSSKELDIEVILRRIETGALNLQPDFQRGEVWSPSKKKRLIDSILRGWKIPPIHVIVTQDYREEVLDGQQRLVAINEFCDNRIRIDGNISPLNEDILKLDGLCFEELSMEMQRKFLSFPITRVSLEDYLPEEPAELFYRLNQPATLTSAEQRNAYISPSRNQIKDLVLAFEKMNAKSETIGFSNSRLAYDEVLSKFAYSLELETLRKKITSSEMSEKYRSQEPFSNQVLDRCYHTIEILMKVINENSGVHRLKLNKATLFSWLLFVDKNSHTNISKTLFLFEKFRQSVKGNKNYNLQLDFDNISDLKQHYPFLEGMFLIFNHRASMGSTDALSIIYRDIILNLFHEIIHENEGALLRYTIDIYNQTQNFNICLENIQLSFDWGDRI